MFIFLASNIKNKKNKGKKDKYIYLNWKKTLFTSNEILSILIFPSEIGYIKYCTKKFSKGVVVTKNIINIVAIDKIFPNKK